MKGPGSGVLPLNMNLMECWLVSRKVMKGVGENAGGFMTLERPFLVRRRVRRNTRDETGAMLGPVAVGCWPGLSTSQAGKQTKAQYLRLDDHGYVCM